MKRKLYPNVDFYSGILLKAIGIPVEMFTVMFAIGRIPGWVSNWKEIAENAKAASTVLGKYTPVLSCGICADGSALAARKNQRQLVSR